MYFSTCPFSPWSPSHATNVPWQLETSLIFLCKRVNFALEKHDGQCFHELWNWLEFCGWQWIAIYKVLIPPALSAQCYHRLLEHFILLYSNPGFSCFPGLSTCSFLNVLPPVSNSAINSLQSPCDCGQELVIVFSTIFGLFFAVVFFFKLF